MGLPPSPGSAHDVSQPCDSERPPGPGAVCRCPTRRGSREQALGPRLCSVRRRPCCAGTCRESNPGQLDSPRCRLWPSLSLGLHPHPANHQEAQHWSVCVLQASCTQTTHPCLNLAHGLLPMGPTCHEPRLTAFSPQAPGAMKDRSFSNYRPNSSFTCGMSALALQAHRPASGPSPHQAHLSTRTRLRGRAWIARCLFSSHAQAAGPTDWIQVPPRTLGWGRSAGDAQGSQASFLHGSHPKSRCPPLWEEWPWRQTEGLLRTGQCCSSAEWWVPSAHVLPLARHTEVWLVSAATHHRKAPCPSKLSLRPTFPQALPSAAWTPSLIFLLVY